MTTVTRKLASILIVASVTAACLSLAQPSYDVIEARKSEMVDSYVLSIPGSNFTKEVLLRLADDFIQRNAKPMLLDVRIYTDKTTALDSRGKKITHFTYTRWLHECKIRAQRKLADAAELLRLGTSSALRIRYSDGRLEEVAIAGHNIFHPTVNGVTLDLLYFTSEPQGFPAKRLKPHLYFSVPQKLTLEEASVLTQSLFNLYGIREGEMHMRPDQWFVFDSLYPWMNPFSVAQMPPTESTLAQSEEFLCDPEREPPCYQASVGAKQ